MLIGLFMNSAFACPMVVTLFFYDERASGEVAMKSSEDLEALLVRLEQLYDSARVVETAARADYAPLMSHPHASPATIDAARRRLQKAQERLAEISQRLDALELEETP